MADPKTTPCIVKPGARIIHDGRQMMAGETVHLTDNQIAVMADLVELPSGKVAPPIVASTDYIDPLTGTATRTPNPSQPDQARGPTPLEQQQLKAAQEKEIRDKQAAAPATKPK
jgi:hypothetical protein